MPSWDFEVCGEVREANNCYLNWLPHSSRLTHYGFSCLRQRFVNGKHAFIIKNIQTVGDMSLAVLVLECKIIHMRSALFAVQLNVER